MLIDGVNINAQLKSSKILGKGSASNNPVASIFVKPSGTQDRAPYGIDDKSPSSQGGFVYKPWQFKGRGRIVGTVKEKSSPTNLPLKRKVRLYREPDGLLIRTTWSDPVTGAYIFNGIPLTATYTVVSFDHTGAYRAVCADNLTPEPVA